MNESWYTVPPSASNLNLEQAGASPGYLIRGGSATGDLRS